MRKMRAFALLMAAVAALALPAGGCGVADDGIIRYDIGEPVKNLDPQFATDTTARMIIFNIYEGLVVQDAQGAIHPGVAARYEVSADGLHYTFHLREDARWSDGAPLTADDFLFAFERLFYADAPSPFASSYMSIKNAEQMLRENAALSTLGISAPDEQTVVFELVRPDPFFLEALSATAAMPCNRKAFDNARGRYGLEPQYVYENGPFYLEKWDNSKYLLLRNNDQYASDTPVAANGVNLYIGRENALAQFTDGKTDLAMLPYENTAAVRDRVVLESFDKTTWALVFNQNDPVLGDPLIRQALIQAVDHELLGEYLPPNFTPSAVFVPPAMQVLGQSFRAAASAESPLPFDTMRAQYLYELGLSSLEIDALPQITVLVPEDDTHMLCAGQMQQSWQKHLGAYINVEAATAAQITQRFRDGNYQILLMPFSPAGGQVGSLLGVFHSASSQNYTGYQNPRYDALLSQAAGTSAAAIVDAYRRAEIMLLSDAVVMPLYFETTTYAISQKVQGIEIAPFAGRIYFKRAARK